ncbi:MAG: hypothetical protein Q9174_004761 [Haloplaca sp. 1 TL-2023]
MASPEHTDTQVSGDDVGSGDQSIESSANQSRDSSKPPKPRKGVRFTPGGESLDSDNHRAAFDVRDDSNAPPRPTTKPKPLARQNPTAQLSNTTDRTSLVLDSPPGGDIANSLLSRPRRPALKRNSSSSHSEPEEEDSDDGLEMNSMAAGRRAQSQLSAQDRGARLSRMMGSHSAPGSRTASPMRISPLHSPPPSPEPRSHVPPLNFEDIPLAKLHSRRTYGIEDEPDEDAKEQTPMNSNKSNPFRDAAARLVRHHRRGRCRKDQQNSYDIKFKVSAPPTPLRSGQATPVNERHPTDYVPRPNEYREGFLSSILKLYDESGLGANLSHNPVGNVGAANHKRRRSGGSTFSNISSPPHSESATPKRQKWYSNQQAASTGSMASLIHSATNIAGLGGSPAKTPSGEKGRPQRPPLLKSRSASALDLVLGRNKPPKQDESIHIQIHIAETMTRQAYLMKMCKALMNYGAPTHRLEEQMRMSARVLEIDGQFLYIPGCMIISFDDSRTHTTEVKIVRTKQAIDLGKLREVHEIYKETLHDLIGVEEAMERLDQVLQREQQYNRWLLVPVYGLASACVGPFAFGARPIDLPMAFLLGCCLGIMQLIVAPKSELYSNIFEVTAAVLTSFLARAFGSIRNGELFCFSALAQSSIALILPGYTVRKYMSFSPTHTQKQELTYDVE